MPSTLESTSWSCDCGSPSSRPKKQVRTSALLNICVLCHMSTYIVFNFSNTRLWLWLNCRKDDILSALSWFLRSVIIFQLLILLQLLLIKLKLGTYLKRDCLQCGLGGWPQDRKRVLWPFSWVQNCPIFAHILLKEAKAGVWCSNIFSIASLDWLACKECFTRTALKPCLKYRVR